jgi:hypothetical protein
VIKEQLLVPPSTATHYVVVSDAAKHGDVWRWTQADGTSAMRYSQSLRGFITEIDAVTLFSSVGLPERLTVRGVTPQR